MAIVSASVFSPFQSLRTPNHSHSLGIPIPSPTVSFRNVSAYFQRLTHKDRRSRRPTTLRAVEEDTPLPPEEEASVSNEQPVSVPVSPSDTLTMVFQKADGTLSDAAIPSVTKALRQLHFFSNADVEILNQMPDSSSEFVTGNSRHYQLKS